VTYIRTGPYYSTYSHIAVRQMAVKGNQCRLSLNICHWMALTRGDLLALHIIDRSERTEGQSAAFAPR
jgi:hypothetical protein